MNKTDASALQGIETNFKLLEAKIEKIGLDVLEENNYYAFGMKHEGYNNVVTATDPALKYKYNSKEWQDEMGLGWYDYHARNYDPALGRWFNVDPLAEKYYEISPFGFTMNNPLYFVDPNGKEIWIYSGEGNKNREKYSYQKDRDYSKMEGFVADAYKMLDALYVASNITVDGQEVNLIQGLMDDKRELSVVYGGETTGSHFSAGKNYIDRQDVSKPGNKDIGTLYFEPTLGIMYDEELENADMNYFAPQIKSGKLNKTTKVLSPTSFAGHEIGHAWGYMKGTKAYWDRNDSGPVPFGKFKIINAEEASATTLSNQINHNLNEHIRPHYGGVFVKVDGGVSSTKVKKP